MEHTFYSLHDFFIHTKGVTYILIVLALLGMVGFWKFLTGRDEE